MMNLRRATFDMNFKRGVEPMPEEITGPIVGMFLITRYSYEIVWLEEEALRGLSSACGPPRPS